MAKQRKQTPSSILARTRRVLVFSFLGLVAIPTLVQAWTEPLSPPQTYDNDPPSFRETLKFLNPSTAVQQKKGTLIIGTATSGASLCLNSNPAYPAQDPAQCITSWDALRNSPFLHLGKNDGGSLLTQYTDYVAGPLISLKNDPSAGQGYALIAEASSSSASPAVGLTAFANIPGSTGDFNYAGYLAGAVSIADRTGNTDKSLCLNSAFAAGTITAGSTSKGCISRWSDLYYSSAGQAYVDLRQSGTTTVRQNGLIRLSSSVLSGSLVIGSTAGVPLAFSCGDGMCTSDTNPAETTTSCPIDCGGVFSIATFQGFPSMNRAVFDTRTWSNPGINQKIIILRQQGSPPTAAPQDGITYTVGQRIGDATVVFAPGNTFGPNQAFYSEDAGLTNNQTYYYVAYAANAMPRYGTGTNVISVTPRAPLIPVRLTFTYNNRALVDIAEVTFGAPQVLPQPSCTSTCTVYFVQGSRVQLFNDSTSPGYRMNGYSGSCESTTETCTFTVGSTQANILVVVGPTGSGGGGGGGGGSDDNPL